MRYGDVLGHLQGHGGDVMAERWVPVRGYEGSYEVSTLGRIKSLERVVKQGTPYAYTRKARIMLPRRKNNGYLQVRLSKHGKCKSMTVHRIVMESFVGPSTLQVNHINEDKEDNRLENLEYVTASYNNRYSKARPVERYDLVTGETIARYDAEADVARDGFDVGAVNNCVLKKPRYKSHHGYGWRFADGQ